MSPRSYLKRGPEKAAGNEAKTNWFKKVSSLCSRRCLVCFSFVFRKVTEVKQENDEGGGEIKKLNRVLSLAPSFIVFFSFSFFAWLDLTVNDLVYFFSQINASCLL